MFKLYPYQSQFINNPSRLIAINKSKRIGFSEAIAYRAVKKCALDNIEQLLVSSSQRQSNYLMEKVERWVRFYRKNWGFKLDTDSKTEKKFVGGKSIFSLPSKPETITGFDGDVSIDEYAFHQNDADIYKSLTPTLAKGRQVIISSTPLGQSNKFYEIFTDEYNYPDFDRITVNIYDAIKQGCDLNAEIVKRNSTSEEFQESYLCQFVDESTAYFTYQLMKSIIREYDVNKLSGENFGGIDIGRTQDRFAFAVINQSDKLKLKHLEVIHNEKFNVMFDVSCRMIEENNLQRCLVDKGAIGMQLAEELEDKYPTIVEGVMFSNIYKNELATNGKKLMENKDFEMFEHKELISDFHSIKRNVTSSNQVNFDSKRDSTGHGDRAWAVMLGLRAATVTQPSYDIVYV